MIDVRDWIALHAHRTPNALAQVDIASGRRFTYHQMNDRVGRIAGYLRSELDVQLGNVVAVLGDNSSDIFDVDFACGRCGAIFLPMNTRLAAAELAFQLTDATPKVIFVGAGYEAVASQAIKLAKSTAVVFGFGDNTSKPHLEDIAQGGPVFDLSERRKADDGWTLIYSSGTTGRPKGVLHTHGGVMMQAIGDSVPLGLSVNSVGLTVLPQFHISGLNIFGHAMFYAGASQITMNRFIPAEMLGILSDKSLGVTHFAAVPTIFEMLAHMPEFKDADLSSVEGAFVGGAASTEALLRTYADKGLPLIQGYGLTETGPTVTVLDADDAIAKLGSAGKAIMHVDLKIMTDKGLDAAPGEVGEILTKGPSVIQSYFRRPEAQATSFQDGWLRTGDMGYLDKDGFLFIVDRKKDMFISGGENVYPAEVENCLADIDGVVQVAVIGVPDAKWGEVGAACIVKAPGSDLTAANVTDFCDGRIARYKIPKHVRFFDALPIGGTGKVQKNDLRELFAKAD